jgi:hypothetical protein
MNARSRGTLLVAAATVAWANFAAQASESTTRLRLPGPGAAAPQAAPAAAPAAPAAAPTGLTLRMPAPAKADSVAPDPPGAPPQSKTLPDGTIAISTLLMTQEMLQNQQAAIAKYVGKPIQFQGPIDYHLINEIGAFIGMTARLPIGYRKFYCISFDRDSVAAARALKLGDLAVVAGVYITPDLLPQTQAAYMGGLQSYDTLNFVECVVLTGHPNPALARALMAGWANERRLGK